MLKKKLLRWTIISVFGLGISTLASCKYVQYRLIEQTKEFVMDRDNFDFTTEVLNLREEKTKATVIYGNPEGLKISEVPCKKFLKRKESVIASKCELGRFKDFAISARYNSWICPDDVDIFYYYGRVARKENCEEFYKKAYSLNLSNLSLWDGYETTLEKAAYIKAASMHRLSETALKHLFINPNKSIILIQKEPGKNANWAVEYILYNKWSVVFLFFNNESLEEIKEFVRHIRLEPMS
ncbi:hypothetical protein EHQ12_05220 [Leptospira gomenensis]|uniref:Lipoprotein n=1 Tax=Leptospira gomenensis TaxID=2484974 RepID=A0A5F1Y856_9LEPT|nr:hypothetical protein [Leptospira gomenensis]TGK29545.1 hypothetical protein EHQ17_15595 [Leptospira gomenensis]TGK42022.1 hypothetical protein EHQ12_05220 [Leptospira gomenensis]TGK48897.1 hypothetical protein EHQ07_05390 [Leptospira gomenensis]TGK65700.1 hypothetical protein EHQ13_04850 [Leptospira gomenensis]